MDIRSILAADAATKRSAHVVLIICATLGMLFFGVVAVVTATYKPERDPYAQIDCSAPAITKKAACRAENAHRASAKSSKKITGLATSVPFVVFFAWLISWSVRKIRGLGGIAQLLNKPNAIASVSETPRVRARGRYVAVDLRLNPKKKHSVWVPRGQVKAFVEKVADLTGATIA